MVKVALALYLVLRHERFQDPIFLIDAAYYFFPSINFQQHMKHLESLSPGPEELEFDLMVELLVILNLGWA